MSLIDRHILARFIANFAVLFTLLFVFAIAVDVILDLDRYVKAAHDASGDGAGAVHVGIVLGWLIFDYQAPHVFQFYAYLHGLVAIGAMGFTLAQMVRYRELVAIMASGVSLYRLALPFILAVFGLSVLQLLNQELLLPRVAPLLLRDKGDIGRRELDSFPVKFSPDGAGSLLQAPAYNPQTHTLTAPTILERDARGRTVRRIIAESAVWNEAGSEWRLSGGQSIARPAAESQSQSIVTRTPVSAYKTDLSPQVLLVRHYNEFASMLSMGQIDQMLQTRSITDTDALRRHYFSRFAAALVNLLVLVLTLPTFLLREPANLLRQSLLCASLAIPASVGAAIGMMVELPGISPGLGVFLPVAVLMCMAIVPWTFFKT